MPKLFFKSDLNTQTRLHPQVAFWLEIQAMTEIGGSTWYSPWLLVIAAHFPDMASQLSLVFGALGLSLFPNVLRIQWMPMVLGSRPELTVLGFRTLEMEMQAATGDP